MFCVYKIKNTNNSKLYVGYSMDLANRWRSHKDLARAGEVSPLYNDMRTIGIEAFSIEVISEELETQNEALWMEQYWQKQLNCSVPSGYNTNISKCSLSLDFIKNDVRTRLKDFIKKDGRKLKWVATQLNITKCHLSTVLRCERPLSKKNIEKIKHIWPRIDIFCQPLTDKPLFNDEKD